MFFMTGQVAARIDIEALHNHDPHMITAFVRSFVAKKGPIWGPEIRRAR